MKRRFATRLSMLQRDVLTRPGYNLPFAFDPVRSGSRLVYVDDYGEISYPRAMSMMAVVLAALGLFVVLGGMIVGPVSAFSLRAYLYGGGTLLVSAMLGWLNQSHRRLEDRMRVLVVDPAEQIAVDLVLKRGSGSIERVDVQELSCAGPFQSEINHAVVNGWQTVYFRFKSAAWLVLACRVENDAREYADRIRCSGLSVLVGEKITGPSRDTGRSEWNEVVLDVILGGSGPLKEDRWIRCKDLISQSDLAVLNAAVDKIIRDAKAGVSYAVPASGPLPSS